VATEEGVVIRKDASGTWVKTLRSGACDSCSSKAACHSMGGGKEMEVAAVNTIEARVGERVILKMDTAPFLKGTFLVYLFPILLLVVGAAVGEWIARSSGLDSPWPSAVLGFAALAVGLLLVKIIAGRLVKKDAYRPRISRVIGRPERPFKKALNGEPENRPAEGNDLHSN
jgi:sigma-E factor negative regulatory protein RseC